MPHENPIFRFFRRKGRRQEEVTPTDTLTPEIVPLGILGSKSTKIEFDGRLVVVKNNFPLQDFITGLNEHDPGAELFARTREDDFRVLWGGGIYLPDGICTDGVVNGVSPHLGPDTLDVSAATYLAWVATEHKPRKGETTPPDRTSKGTVPTYFMMSRQPMHELREQANAIPGNTIKLVHWR